MWEHPFWQSLKHLAAVMQRFRYRPVGFILCTFPFDITYTEQDSGKDLIKKLGISASLNFLQLITGKKLINQANSHVD